MTLLDTKALLMSEKLVWSARSLSIVLSAAIHFTSTVCHRRLSHECQWIQLTGVVNVVDIVKSVVSSLTTALYVSLLSRMIMYSFVTNNNNTNSNNNNNQNNVYSSVMMAVPLWEFSRFMWWIQHTARWPPTSGLNQLDWGSFQNQIYSWVKFWRFINVF